ncbi:very-long-chain 3-oxoacyl-CoA reductase-like isoform X1 [Homalodisca vitripennis]|uniref:Steroid dehydrogenase n=2 Tax=Homalodisca liturata TaxID=320908 RepID=A0A1B6I742_9HEMI|nr:very-long-chain 3-oxoacyl-CoA reductase-like isoform X1 [Homalodisca vitripennis]
MFTPLEKVGVVCLSILGFQIARAVLKRVYNSVLAPAFRLNVNLKEMGQWAVITGATDGLGKAFAEAVAKRGMDVVLISRTKSKLDAVAQEIRENYKVNTKVIEADFTEGNTVYHHIEKELYGMDVGVLINNVGLSYPHPDQFLSLPEHGKVYHDIIQCNIAAMLSMCQIVMPGMCEQRRGVVINIGSTAGDIPSPMLTVYGASKVFVSKFSRDLASEYKQYGIVVQCLTPGYVATKMSKIKKPTWMAPSPAKYVNSALTTVGIEDHTTGYYPHSLLVGCIKLMESLSPNFAYWMITRTMENIKSRAIRKSNQIAAS